MSKKSKQKNKIENKVEEVKIPHLNFIIGLILVSIVAVSLYLRVVLPYDTVFNSGIVKFAADDAVYHMRLVENTLHNFPYRITYDAFTTYPYGSTLHWGPLFTLIISSTSLITGLGNPSMDLVNTVGAFMPAIMGALIVIPTYFISKNLFDSKVAGLMSALLIAVLPGQFYSRSVLGFTDHHVAEVLFTTLTLCLYIISLKYSNDRVKSVKYSVFAGLMFSAYLLTWTGAPFFVFIILIFVLIQSLTDVLSGREIKYLVYATVPMFLVMLIMVLPFTDFSYGFGRDKYSLFHVTVLLIGAIFPIIVYQISRKFKSISYALALIGCLMLCVILTNLLIPQMFVSLINAPKLIFAFPTGGASTVAEALSMLEKPGMFAGSFPILFGVHSDMLVLLFMVLILVYIGFRYFKNKRPEILLFLIWTVVMLLAIAGQNRWGYYYAVNAALIVGFCYGVIFNKLSSKIVNPFSQKKNIVYYSILVIFVVLFAYPSFVTSYSDSKWVVGEPSGGGYNEWYNALTWMRNNTPDTGLDYYGVYENPIKDNREATPEYNYPNTSYGVMSWWDYGHIITYYAHRIPIANPFQSGIGGGKDKIPGASMFLTAKTEDDANKIMDEFNAKYFITDSYMAYEIMEVFGVWAEDKSYFMQVQTNKGNMIVPSKDYFDNMEAKLHIYDGNGLKHYRLIYESNVNPNTLGGHREQQFKYISNTLYQTNIPVENSGLVKIFEYVPGYNINGFATPNTEVTLSTNIVTNINRNIYYSQKTISDSFGIYNFTVPYDTKYTITYGNMTEEITV